MIENILFLDAETYYDREYSLRKMPTPCYILDKRFEEILWAVAVNNEPSKIVDAPDFGEWLSQFNQETTATVTYNALFDNSVLSWVHGWTPALMLDSMNMARALRGHILPRLSLEMVAPILLGRQKGSAIKNMVGVNRAELKHPIRVKGASVPTWNEFCAYAIEDNEQSRDIFKLLIGEFPHAERRLMDLVIRTTVQPKFRLDRSLLDAHLKDLQYRKADLIMALGQEAINPDTSLPALRDEVALQLHVRSAVIKQYGLMSNVKFKQVLKAKGVAVGTKISSATGKETPAFAKTDKFMQDLLEHPDLDIQALASARLGVKSTIEETRTEKFIAIAALPWDRYRDGNPRFYSGGEMPVPLRYGAAHTHRLAGDWGLNMQNLPRGSKLRKALKAPPECSVVTADLRQIEARLVAWISGCWELLSTFSKGDPYSAFASLVFGFPVDKNLHPVHRFIGKTGVLGLGYGCGEDKFYTMVTTLAAVQGIKLDGSQGIVFDKALASKTVAAFRNKYWQIRRTWGKLDTAVQQVWANNNGSVMNLGPVTISYGKITGPGGLVMNYNNPHYDDVSQEYIYTYGGIPHKMYGAKMLENIIQFLARIIVMNAALRLNGRGYRFVLQAHDELVFIVPDQDVDNAKKIIYQEMTRSPSWGKDIPLDVEVKSGKSYGECK